MIYLLDENAGEEKIQLRGETYKYLVKVLRFKEGDKLDFRNKESIDKCYTYQITTVDARSLHLELLTFSTSEVQAKRELHVAWCVIDTKSIEKVLPILSEIGVNKISFIYCDRSQKNFKLDFKRFDRIVEASMQQSGRTNKMEFDIYKNIVSFIKDFPKTKVFDFSDNLLKGENHFKRVLIGCEGGFSPEEKDFLKDLEVFRLDTPMILRSESAVVAVASKILL